MYPCESARVLRPHRRPDHMAVDALRGLDYPTATVGQTAHVTVLVATQLGAAGLAVGKAILPQVEATYQEVMDLFGRIALPPATLIVAPLSPRSDGTGGAYHASCAATDLYCDADLANPVRTLALFVAELSEVGQAVQAAGWDCGATNGEGLSRVHAEVLFPGALDDFETVSAWLDGNRPNWVDRNEGTDQDPVSNGCAVLFLYWLHSLGYTYAQITQAAAPSLAGTYQKLAGKTSAWSDFQAAVNANWPEGKPSGVTKDNPWPAAPAPPAPPAPAKGPLTAMADVVFAALEGEYPGAAPLLADLNAALDLFLDGR